MKWKIFDRPTPNQVGLILVFGVFSVSTTAVFIRLAIDAAGTSGVGFSLFLAASRLNLAALILLPAWRSLRGRLLSQRGVYAAGAAGLCLAVHMAAWITSLSFTSIVASTTLVTTNPIWMVLISWLWFREKPTQLTLGGIAIALSGSSLIALGGAETASPSPNPLLGDALALIAAWMVSLYLLFGREAQRSELGTGGYIAIAYTTAALVLLPLPLLFGISYHGYPQAVYGYILLIAFMSQVVGHTTLNWAVRWISPTLVTLVILFEPVGSGLLGFWVFGERPGGWAMAGAVLVLVGVATAVLGTPGTEDSQS